jgi:proline dehydrogenase
LQTSTEKLLGYLRWAKDCNLKTGIKLVRGAYMGQENFIAKKAGVKSPIHESKELTTECYNENLKLVFENYRNGNFLCIASHNETSIRLGQELMWEYRIHRIFGGIAFAQLLGMKSALGINLAKENYIVQKYIPFGPFDKLIPYLGRRAYEQSATISEMKFQIQQIFEELEARYKNL